MTTHTAREQKDDAKRKFTYQSFTTQASTDGAEPQIAAPWTPPVPMELTTTDGGEISGTASLGAAVFDITGRLNQGENGPIGVQLTITVEVTKSTYELQGWFLQGSDHIVGTVVCLSNDLGVPKRAVGTSGSFALYPTCE